MAGNAPPGGWAIWQDYTGVPVVIEGSTIDLYRPGRLWIVEQRGDCGVTWACAAPVPVPLDGAGLFLIAALVSLVALRCSN